MSYLLIPTGLEVSDRTRLHNKLKTRQAVKLGSLWKVGEDSYNRELTDKVNIEKFEKSEGKVISTLLKIVHELSELFAKNIDKIDTDNIPFGLKQHASIIEHIDNTYLQFFWENNIKHDYLEGLKNVMDQ